MAAARIPRVFTRLVSSTPPQPASTLLTSPAQNTYTTLTTKDLRALLQARALKPWGKKPELISRLVASDAMSTRAQPEPSKVHRAAKEGQEHRGSNIARATPAEKPARAASTIAATFERAKAAVASTINGPATPATPATTTTTAATAAAVKQRLEFTVSPLAVPKPWELAALETPAELVRVPYIQSTEATAKHRGEVVPRVVVHQPAVNVLEGDAAAAGRVGVVTEVGDDTVVGVPGQEAGEVVREGKEMVEEVKGVVGKATEAVASWGGWGGKESKTGKIFAGDEGQAMTAEKAGALKIGALGASAWVVLGEPVMRVLGII